MLTKTGTALPWDGEGGVNRFDGPLRSVEAFCEMLSLAGLFLTNGLESELRGGESGWELEMLRSEKAMRLPTPMLGTIRRRELT